jgi:isopenicillin-N N-acyltransferase-like protein
VAQIVDLSPFNLESMILLKSIPDVGPRTLSVTFAGILSQEGINSEGLALCGSHVLSKDWCKGYPARNFLRRHLFEQPSIDRVEKELHAVFPRGSGHNIVLADRTEKIVNFEITPHTYRTNLPNQAGFCIHTNHYIHSELRELDWFKSHDPEYYENSQRRFGRAEDLLKSHSGVVSFDVIRRVLSDHQDGPDAICRHAENDRFGNSSVVSMIGVPLEGEIHLIPGNPCEGTWKSYRL